MVHAGARQCRPRRAAHRVLPAARSAPKRHYRLARRPRRLHAFHSRRTRRHHGQVRRRTLGARAQPWAAHHDRRDGAHYPASAQRHHSGRAGQRALRPQLRGLRAPQIREPPAAPSAAQLCSPGDGRTLGLREQGDRRAAPLTLISAGNPHPSCASACFRLTPHAMSAKHASRSDLAGDAKAIVVGDRVALGKTVAVLAVDPTSTRSGGSILGDKTRMGRLATEQGAFIRPSPAGDSLGGVTKTTRETIALVEAAGYDVVLVETVGVGQSETAFSNMVDVSVVVGIPGAGDELQGIKRGLLELADVIAVNKADGDQVERANRAAMEYRTALHILAAGHPNWSPVVLTVSARDNSGLDELWTKVEDRHATLQTSGALHARRAEQAVAWMREIFEQRLLAAFKGGKEVGRRWSEMETKVRSGEITPTEAAAKLGRLAGIGEG